MPKRTNEFQALIRLIEGQLSPTGASVEESVMITDQLTGEAREVDIVIRSKVGDHTVVIGIECQKHDRKAHQMWIDQLKGKYANLPVDVVVAVARAGFTKGALTSAARSNIRTLTLESAGEVDWQSEINRLRNVYITHNQPTIERIKIRFRSAPPASLKQSDVETAIVGPEDQPPLTLGEFVEKLLWTPDAQEDLSRRYKAHKDELANGVVRIPVRMRFIEGEKSPLPYLDLGSQGHHSFDLLDIELSVEQVRHTISPEKYSYKDKHVAVAKADLGGHEYTFSVVEGKELPLAVSYMRKTPGNDKHDYGATALAISYELIPESE